MASITLVHSRSGALQPAEPLWKHAPTRDSNGHPVSDFMMLIRGLRDQSPQDIASVVARLQQVFAHYSDAVLFADLNLRLNLLWVSVRPVPGICLELPTALNAHIPEARLVGLQPEACVGRQRSHRQP